MSPRLITTTVSLLLAAVLTGCGTSESSPNTAQSSTVGSFAEVVAQAPTIPESAMADFEGDTIVEAAPPRIPLAPSDNESVALAGQIEDVKAGPAIRLDDGTVLKRTVVLSVRVIQPIKGVEEGDVVHARLGAPSLSAAKAALGDRAVVLSAQSIDPAASSRYDNPRQGVPAGQTLLLTGGPGFGVANGPNSTWFADIHETEAVPLTDMLG